MFLRALGPRSLAKRLTRSLTRVEFVAKEKVRVSGASRYSSGGGGSSPTTLFLSAEVPRHISASAPPLRY